MQHDKKLIEKIAEDVQDEYKMGRLADGLYLDFATDVAIRYADKILQTICEHPFASVVSKCDGEINTCLKCGAKL